MKLQSTVFGLSDFGVLLQGLTVTLLMIGLKPSLFVV